MVKDSGKIALAYFEIGAIEDFRPEWNLVPEDLKSGKVEGWPNEQYVRLMGPAWWPIIKRRVDQAFVWSPPQGPTAFTSVGGIGWKSKMRNVPERHEQIGPSICAGCIARTLEENLCRRSGDPTDAPKCQVLPYFGLSNLLQLGVIDLACFTATCILLACAARPALCPTRIRSQSES